MSPDTYEYWKDRPEMMAKRDKCCLCQNEIFQGDIYLVGPQYRDGMPPRLAHRVCVNVLKNKTNA
jgi:hypothetical protein